VEQSNQDLSGLRHSNLTQDQDFLRLHAASAAHLGIAYRRKDTSNIGEIIQGLLLIWDYYDAEDLSSRIEYL
jgi:hypothetical protein